MSMGEETRLLGTFVPRCSGDGPRRPELRRGIVGILQQLGAGRLPYSGQRTLYQHLMGTAEILMRWSQPEETCIAGACHSIYGTDVFRTSLVPIAQRSEVAAAIGERAERLVYLFGTIQREDLLSSLQYHGRIPAHAITIGGEPRALLVSIAPSEVAALLAIYMATEVDQAQALDGGPTEYIGCVLRWGGYLRPGRDVCPEIVGLRRPPSLDDERRGGQRYRQGLEELANRPELGKHAFVEAGILCPSVGEPHVWLAYLALRQGRGRLARSRAAFGRFLLERWAAPWDKRLTLDSWILLTRIVYSLGGSARVDGASMLPWPDPDDLPGFVSRLVAAYFGERADGPKARLGCSAG